MKESDLNSSRLILKLIGALTEDECSAVEICNENPDWNGMPDNCITVHTVTDDLQMSSEDFRADTLLECLLLAVQKRNPKLVERWGKLDVYLYNDRPVILEQKIIDVRAPTARAYWVVDGAVGSADVPIRELKVAKHIQDR